MIKSDLTELSIPFDLKTHKAMNLLVHSPSLEGNPLGDSAQRHNYVLLPKGKGEKFPVIFHLSGYFSTGFQSFNVKSLSQNFVQEIDRGVSEKRFPKAIHVFVEATTYWGGSQFINSPGCGRYQDYVLKDLYKSVKKNFSVSEKENQNCVMGASSGGYGALSLVSEKNSPFGLALAVAPDSYFEASLLPELFQGASELNKYKNFSQLKKLIDKGELQDKRSFFSLMNIIAMSHCYAPEKSIKKDFIELPIDLYSGELNSSVWKEWLKKDPIVFLKRKKKNLQGKEIYLDVGKYDNFSLQFGTRQIAEVLKKEKVKHTYSEFSGNHFGLTKRRLLFLETLAKKWRKFV